MKKAGRPERLDFPRRKSSGQCNTEGIHRQIFPRSANKLMQGVAMLRSGLPLRGESSARTRFAIGPHLTNRVGHVQGGISVGVAARCACAAAPKGMMLSNITAWYISPGRGKSLKDWRPRSLLKRKQDA